MSEHHRITPLPNPPPQGGRERTEYAALTSSPDVSPAGLTTQVGFIRLAHSKRPNSGKPEFGRSIVLRKTFFAKRMDCRGISAFTRVHSPSKTGVNALNDALCPAMTAEQGRALVPLPLVGRG